MTSKPTLRRDLYNCRHFTEAWTQREVGKDKNSKGLAGELGLYYALKLVAKWKNYRPPTLLGEPSPAPDPQVIARTNDYPDCYMKVDAHEFLFEAKNIFYYHGNWKKGTLFYVQQENWIRSLATQGKKWYEKQYPVRGTQQQVRHGTRREWEYQEYITITNIQNVTKVYVSTVPSLNDWAWGELEGFFGQNLIWTHHPILETEDPGLTAKFVQTPGDRECSLTTLAWLTAELSFLIDRNLRGTP